MSPYFRCDDEKKGYFAQIHGDTDFANCCGARIISGLYLNTTKAAPEPEIYETIAKELREVLEEGHPTQAIYCILSQEETHKGWYTILKLCGFEDVHSFVNGNTGNSLTLYVLNPTEEYEGEEQYEDDF